jgi:hypothetical protein
MGPRPDAGRKDGRGCPAKITKIPGNKELPI